MLLGISQSSLLAISTQSSNYLWDGDRDLIGSGRRAGVIGVRVCKTSWMLNKGITNGLLANRKVVFPGADFRVPCVVRGDRVRMMLR